MAGSDVTRKLAHSFYGSYINYNLEFIAHEKANEYFRHERTIKFINSGYDMSVLKGGE